MSSSIRDRERATTEVKEDRPVQGGPCAPLPTWLERMQNVRARHEAITGSLNTWSNYKNWAERMRTTLAEESAQPDAEPPAGKGTTTPNH